MPETKSPDEKDSQSSSRVLVMLMLGLIVLSIVAFLVLRPDPSGAGHNTTHPATTDH
jgi:hypothetical protein